MIPHGCQPDLNGICNPDCRIRCMSPSPPGDTIRDILEERGLSKLEVEQKLGLSEGSMNDLLIGYYPINENLAHKLSEVLGSTPEFWMNRERHYREEHRAEEEVK